MILSRHPIVDADFFRFSLNGNVHQILYGDALAGAGVGMARVVIQVHFENIFGFIFIYLMPKYEVILSLLQYRLAAIVHHRLKVGYPFVREKTYPKCDPILLMTLI